jgi:hypothetical protein
VQAKIVRPQTTRRRLYESSLPSHINKPPSLSHCSAINCPLHLGQEIILTGSVSKGLADEQSDIEQVFFVRNLPSSGERDAWLHQIGASEIMHDESPIADGSIWSTFRFQDVWIEASWQTFAHYEALLRLILDGNVLDHARLILAEITTQAVSVRTQGMLEQWQQWLALYPESLAPRLIANAIEIWRFPHLLAARWTLLQRQDYLRLAELLLRHLHEVLRVLFALNRQWEPEWKWLPTLTSRLPIKPLHLIERMTNIVTVPEPETHGHTCFELMRETLALLPPSEEVLQALVTVQNSLVLHQESSP